MARSNLACVARFLFIATSFRGETTTCIPMANSASGSQRQAKVVPLKPRQSHRFPRETVETRANSKSWNNERRVLAHERALAGTDESRKINPENTGSRTTGGCATALGRANRRVRLVVVSKLRAALLAEPGRPVIFGAAHGASLLRRRAHRGG